MEDKTRLEAYLLEVLGGYRLIGEAAREICLALVGLDRVAQRYPSLTKAELRELVSDFLIRSHDIALRHADKKRRKVG